MAARYRSRLTRKPQKMKGDGYERSALDRRDPSEHGSTTQSVVLPKSSLTKTAALDCTCRLTQLS
jgi:hypothetical protein